MKMFKQVLEAAEIDVLLTYNHYTLQNDMARELVLHCTFGSTLTDPELGPAVRSVLESHPDTYTDVLADHFSRHLEALAAGM